MPPILLRSGRVSRRLLVLECTTSARPSYPSTTVSLPFASWSSWKSASHSLLNRSLSTTTRSALSVQTSRVNQHLRPPQTEPLLQMATKSYKVLIAGSCYAGLAAVVNLLDKVETINSPVSVEITLVDERGGFCMFGFSHLDDHRLFVCCATLLIVYFSIFPVNRPCYRIPSCAIG